MRERAYGSSVRGGGPTRSGEHDRQGAGRPHWWALLAVTLALMALVAALSPHGPARPTTALHQADPAPLGGGGTEAGAAPPTTSPAPAGTSVTPSPTERTGPVLAAGGAPSTTAPTAPTTTSSVVTGPPVSTTATGTPSTPSTTAPTTAPTVPTGLGPVLEGYLQYPQNIKAIYTVNPGSGITAIGATWTGMAALSLSSECPSATQSTTGPSGLTVPVSTAGGGCTVVLAEPPDTDGTASYVLAVASSSS